ncbi:MAG: tRNA 2-thiouridine(34) synthase MnmA [Actinomycetota bacterium]|nr:tRNA 2-thiouridine(34) synthase MnmA [Actinomycetota bacterium]
MSLNPELFAEYVRDDARCGPAPAGAHTGSAGGSACGDLVRISLRAEDGHIAEATFGAEGCAALRACAAAACDEAEGVPVLQAAAISAADIARAVGGVGTPGRHAAELVADALARALSSLASSGAQIAVTPPSERVLVAVSGGVDSAVAALVERERGADVVAVTLKLWADERTDGTQACCSPEAVRGARSLCHELGIPHFTLDLESAFRREVVDAFVGGYRAGETPNPCVICNGDLRIDAMVALADRVGARSLATGHYARLEEDGSGPLLRAGADPAKDQTYMLSGLRPETLARLRFPLGELTKPEVRALAAAEGLAVASKRESQDLCFLAGEGKRSFLERLGGLADSPGEVVTPSGEVIGEHPGHHHYTVGQRRGLGVSLGTPAYVTGTDAETNRVTVGTKEDLARTTVRLRAARLHRDSRRASSVRLRYHARALPCRVQAAGAGEHAELELELGEPAYGVAPGQTACLYDGDLVIGRATIAGAA